MPVVATWETEESDTHFRLVQHPTETARIIMPVFWLVFVLVSMILSGIPGGLLEEVYWGREAVEGSLLLRLLISAIWFIAFTVIGYFVLAPTFLWAFGCFLIEFDRESQTIRYGRRFNDSFFTWKFPFFKSGEMNISGFRYIAARSNMEGKGKTTLLKDLNKRGVVIALVERSVKSMIVDELVENTPLERSPY